MRDHPFHEKRRNCGRRKDDSYLRPVRNKLTRAYFCASTIIASITGLVDPHSLGWLLVEEIGEPAGWIMGALLVMTVLAFIDVVVNDFLPPNWKFEWVSRHRHIIYLAVAAIYAAFVFVAVQRGHTTMLIWRYLLDCAMAAVIAVLDVYHRYIEPRKREKNGAPAPKSRREPWWVA